MIEVIWEFSVKREAADRFERAYGPAGDWVRLFQHFSGYRGTTLLRDAANPRRYVTIDRWDSEEQRAAMLAAGASEYAQLDRACADLTESEALVGAFITVSG